MHDGMETRKKTTLVALLLIFSGFLVSDSESAGLGVGVSLVNRENSDEIVDPSSSAAAGVGGSLEVQQQDDSPIYQLNSRQFDDFEKSQLKSGLSNTNRKPLVLFRFSDAEGPGGGYIKSHSPFSNNKNINSHHLQFGKALGRDDDENGKKSNDDSDEYWDISSGQQQQQLEIGRKYDDDISPFINSKPQIYGRPTYGQLLAHHTFNSGGRRVGNELQLTVDDDNSNNNHQPLKPLSSSLSSRNAKRSPSCMRKCIQQGYLHPAQCHSMC